MKETALVTGACGFVGSHMVELLLSLGYEVAASDHPAANIRSLPAGARFIPMDMTRPETMGVLNDLVIHKVFHIAGLFDYLASWERLYEVNCKGTERLLEALAPQKPNLKSIIVWSSGSVYGSNFRKEPLAESEAPSPINLYEKSKLLQEEIALQYGAQHGLPVVVIRPSAIYGPRSRYGLAVPVFLIKKGLLRFIPGKGDSIGGFIHVRDVVGAAEFLSGKPDASGKVFNLSDDSNMRIEDAIKLAASLVNARMLPVHVPMAPIRAAAFLDRKISGCLGRRPVLERDLIDYLDRDFWMDNSKLKNSGYALRYPTLKDGLPETVRWYREKQWI